MMTSREKVAEKWQIKDIGKKRKGKRQKQKEKERQRKREKNDLKHVKRDRLYTKLKIIVFRDCSALFLEPRCCGAVKRDFYTRLAARAQNFQLPSLNLVVAPPACTYRWYVRTRLSDSSTLSHCALYATPASSSTRTHMHRMSTHTYAGTFELTHIHVYSTLSTPL